MKKFFAKLVMVTFVFSAFVSTVFAGDLLGTSSVNFEAYGLDTVAGVNTYLRTSKTTPNASIVFDVKKPDGDIVNVSAVTNANGVAQAELSDYHTRLAGQYFVVGHFENSDSVGRVNAFDVLPGDVSVSMSSVDPTDQVVHSSNEDASIEVLLTDEFKNSISGHVVTLVSSSSEDLVSPVSVLTDELGRADFSVSSDVSGTTTYTVFDSTADLVLDQRAKVLYVFDGADVFSDNISAPDHYFSAASGSGALNVDSFGFSKVNPSIGVGDSVTFTVTALDAADQKVVDYDGTVRFSIDGGNSFYANLPDDYAFTEADLGEHTFSLSTSFLKEGSYAVKVQDLDNPALLGEYNFIVGGVDGSNVSSSSITVSNPVAGTYSNPVQVISGITDAGASIKIYDNDLEISSMNAGLDGAFSYTTGVLADGLHSIYVATVNEIGTVVDTSNVVNFTIDTASPDVDIVSLDPSSNVDPSTVVTARITTNDNLAQAAIMVDGSVYEMQPSLDGGYITSFSAPVDFGDYSIDLITVDELGNESRVDSAALLSVGVFGNAAAVLGDVSGLEATTDDHRVTLEWIAPSNSVNSIKNYRVYFGLSPSQLTEAVDTFTNSPTWYIPNLKNGITYYFAVVAVDDTGNVSEHFSNIVSATPNPVVAEMVDPDISSGAAGSEALEEMDSDVSETGPEVVWLLFAALIGGYFYNKSLSRRAKIREITESYEEIINEAQSIKKKIRDSLFK